LSGICRLEDLKDPGSGGFQVEKDGEQVRIMVIRIGPSVWGYVNSCPHIGAPLDWVQGWFLDRSRTRILCASHGATFRIEDGFCVGGPCAGDALTPFPVEVRDGWVIPLQTGMHGMDGDEQG
jgi:nitrite reductase/ring-hydroxylating ferredoxin subunit